MEQLWKEYAGRNQYIHDYQCPAPIIMAMYMRLLKSRVWIKASCAVQFKRYFKRICGTQYLHLCSRTIDAIGSDICRYCAENLPEWNSISISGYHIREAGATAVQEVAFTLANGIAYVQLCWKEVCNRLFRSAFLFLFCRYTNLLEEVAKFRAARRIWAKIIKKRFGSSNPRSQMLRYHVQTDGFTLTAQQPLNNIIRVTLQALAGVLGGCQSLHTNSLMKPGPYLPSKQFR
jgi:methylmalonyl-CoA mutase N-terminal domain/subunit